ncbi:unnamed protein product, partial [Cyprideis torosa]
MARKNPAKLSLSELKRVTLKDMTRLLKEKKLLIPEIPVDNKLLKLALDELNSLIGIENVKSQIEELVDIVRFHRESGRSVISTFSFHTVFVGNPGTDRQGLVAGFVGQTAIKTAERVDEAMGGVLFIDEAYALSNFNGLQGDYGNEAIQTLLKRMEDNRGEFFVFAAGYPGNMEKFLKANPGLSSRFDKTFHFEDYTDAAIFGPAFGFADVYDHMSNVDVQSYVGLSEFDFNQHPVRRYRIIIPMMAAGVHFVFSPIFDLMAPNDFPAEEIREQGYYTLVDAIKHLSGIRVSQPGSGMDGETFLQRGLYGNTYTKILINGTPIRPSAVGAMPIGSQLPIRQAERIEVIYGPAATLYGPDAAAGVINIILKDSEYPTFAQADVEVGDDKLTRVSALFG